MIESNLGAGSQPFPQPKEKLRYGVSITDACIDWPTTETLVREIHAALAPRFRLIAADFTPHAVGILAHAARPD